MTDSPPPTPPSASPPSRPRTFLSRLTAAVREQNWFAVALEVVIVVLGVVIGFQVTAWGQARADADQSREYLRHLAADLCETEQSTLAADSVLGPRDRGNARLVHAFLLADRPSEDSVFAWLRAAGGLEEFSPATGTAEALVATGDLRLIPTDSLRTSIIRYLARVETDLRRASSNIEVWVQSINALSDRYDWSEVLLRTTPRATLDSIARADAFAQVPEGALARPFRFTADDLLADQAAYGHLEQMLNEKRNVAAHRRRIREASRSLRADVEAALREAGGTVSHACSPA